MQSKFKRWSDQIKIIEEMFKEKITRFIQK
jgi:hypothetical protein